MFIGKIFFNFKLVSDSWLVLVQMLLAMTRFNATPQNEDPVQYLLLVTYQIGEVRYELEADGERVVWTSSRNGHLEQVIRSKQGGLFILISASDELIIGSQGYRLRPGRNLVTLEVDQNQIEVYSDAILEEFIVFNDGFRTGVEDETQNDPQDNNGPGGN